MQNCSHWTRTWNGTRPIVPYCPVQCERAIKPCSSTETFLYVCMGKSYYLKTLYNFRLLDSHLWWTTPDNQRNNLEQESPPARPRGAYRPHRTSVLVPCSWGGCPYPDWGKGYPYLMGDTPILAGVPPGRNLGPETGVSDPLPKKGPGTRGWERDLGPVNGVPPVDRQTDAFTNITFPLCYVWEQ